MLTVTQNEKQELQLKKDKVPHSVLATFYVESRGSIETQLWFPLRFHEMVTTYLFT